MKNKSLLLITFLSVLSSFTALGQCWERVYEHPNALEKLQTYDIYFLNDSIGWVVTAHLGGNEPLAKTIDGGETWVPNTNLPFAIGTYVTVYFVSEQVGWVGGSEVIYQTTNGGETWIEGEVENADMASTTFLDIKYINPDLGWAVGGGTSFGNNGMKIFHSNNGGMYWELQLNAGENQVAWEIDFINELEVWVAASSDFGTGILLHTEDGGDNWEEALNLQNGSFKDVFFLNDTVGWVCGKNTTLLKTTDGGENWTPLPVPVTEYPFQGYSVHFVDENTGWMGGTYGQGVYITTDGGQTWNKQVDFVGINWEIQMTSPDRGYAIDSYGFVYRYRGAEAQCNATLEHPAPGTTNASLYPLISWLSASGCYDGYNLMLGLNPGGDEVLPLTDMGKDTSFQITEALPEASTIYATIQPYNYVYGAAEACQSFAFTTTTCPSNPTITSAGFCPGDSLTWQDSVITTTGEYSFHYQTALGCDSTEILQVTQYEVVTIESDTLLCEGEELFWGNKWIDAPGTYATAYQTSNGCDSTEILHVIGQESPYLQIDTAFCLGDAFFWQDSLLTDPGVYTFHHFTTAGCDSTIEVHLAQLPNSNTFIDTVLLTDEPFQGVFYEQDTTLVELFEAANGCDSTVTIHLHVVTGTIVLAEASPWRIYPNPAVDQLWVQGPTVPEAILMYDAAGHLVRRFTPTEISAEGIDGNYRLRLGNMAAGIFVLSIRYQDQTFWDRVVIIR